VIFDHPCNADWERTAADWLVVARAARSTSSGRAQRARLSAVLASATCWRRQGCICVGASNGALTATGGNTAAATTLANEFQTVRGHSHHLPTMRGSAADHGGPRQAGTRCHSTKEQRTASAPELTRDDIPAELAVPPGLPRSQSPDPGRNASRTKFRPPGPGLAIPAA
jgi:hypothetical protein